MRKVATCIFALFDSAVVADYWPGRFSPLHQFELCGRTLICVSIVQLYVDRHRTGLVKFIRNSEMLALLGFEQTTGDLSERKR